MKISLDKAFVTEVKTVALEGKKPFQVIGLMEIQPDGSKGELDLTAPAEIDLSQIPFLVPLGLVISVHPVKAGYRQILKITGISIQKQKGGE